MNPQIFLDMDGVFADFVRHSLWAHNKQIPNGVQWLFYEQVGLTAEEFWKPLEHNYEFWYSIPPLTDGMVLLDWLKVTFPEWLSILTSPGCPGSYDPKVDWLKTYYADPPPLAAAKEKWRFAGPGKILIDDHEANVDLFIEAGGTGILFPRPWNREGYRCESNGQITRPELKRLQCLIRDALILGDI